MPHVSGGQEPAAVRLIERACDGVLECLTDDAPWVIGLQFQLMPLSRGRRHGRVPAARTRHHAMCRRRRVISWFARWGLTIAARGRRAEASGDGLLPWIRLGESHRWSIRLPRVSASNRPGGSCSMHDTRTAVCRRSERGPPLDCAPRRIRRLR